MRAEDPKAFEVLRDFRFWTHASGNDGISIQPHDSVTVIETYPESNEIFRVRWNSSDRGAFVMDPADVDRCREWYDAARYVDITEHGQAALIAYGSIFNGLVSSNGQRMQDRKDLRYEFQLKPGRLLGKLLFCSTATCKDAHRSLAFDNWRVLHGRSSFTGKRRMSGAYSE